MGDPRIEAAARKMCAARCAGMSERPCYEIDGAWPPDGCDCIEVTQAAIRAFLAAEPSEGMVMAAEDCVQYGMDRRRTFAMAWRAMAARAIEEIA